MAAGMVRWTPSFLLLQGGTRGGFVAESSTRHVVLRPIPLRSWAGEDLGLVQLLASRRAELRDIRFSSRPLPPL